MQGKENTTVTFKESSQNSLKKAGNCVLLGGPLSPPT